MAASSCASSSSSKTGAASIGLTRVCRTGRARCNDLENEAGCGQGSDALAGKQVRPLPRRPALPLPHRRTRHRAYTRGRSGAYVVLIVRPFGGGCYWFSDIASLTYSSHSLVAVNDVTNQNSAPCRASVPSRITLSTSSGSQSTCATQARGCSFRSWQLNVGGRSESRYASSMCRSFRDAGPPGGSVGNSSPRKDAIRP